MKLFKKSTLGLALTAAITGGAMMGVTAPASAVSVAANGLGDVLIFPYYKTNDDWRTYFHITNTSDKTVFAKVRWNEGENSRDARDFNVILSPYDVWTAATIPSQTTDGGMVITTDNTCTSPQLGAVAGHPTWKGVDFTNDAYIGTNTDTGTGSGTGTDGTATNKLRTKEGYFTVFEMGVVDESTAYGVALAGWAKHRNAAAKNNTAAPTGCAQLDNAFTNDLIKMKAATTEPENVLKGTAVLINTTTGVAAGYDPVTLSDFFSPLGTDAGDAGDLLQQAQTQFPNMNSVNPAVAQYVGAPLTLQTRPVDAVSELLLRSSLINDFNVAGVSETAWVVTFPTKGFYVDEDVNNLGGSYFKLAQGSGAPIAPFDNNTVGGHTFGTPTKGKSCLNITARLWDREEFESAPDQVVSNFSPVPEDAPSDQQQLCYEANILSFGDSNIFDSSLKSSLFAGNEAGMPGLYGWSKLSFNAPAGASAVNSHALPVVGMKIEQRKDTNQPNKWFGFANDHSYIR